MQQTLVNIPTRKQIHIPTRRNNMNIAHINITAHIRTTADNIPANGIILIARGTLEVRHRDIADRQIRWELVAQRQIVLAIALRYFDGVVHVGNVVVAVGDVFYAAGSSAALEVAGEFCW